MGGNFSRRAAQAHEAVQVMKLLWSEEFVEFHGEFYDFPHVRSSPGPLTKPHLPILLGMHTDHVFGRIVDYADGWLEAVAEPERLEGDGIAHIARGRARLDELALTAGRDPASITIRVLLINREEMVDQKLITRCADAGADHVQLLGTPRAQEAMASERDGIDWLRRVAERVL
jgi:alkanesulfonate monooxygenase SsuD/methylene tetrahydromethanopterin reductase-like flavin-dependent oxidoreductase (luciferase family)